MVTFTKKKVGMIPIAEHRQELFLELSDGLHFSPLTQHKTQVTEQAAKTYTSVQALKEQDPIQ